MQKRERIRKGSPTIDKQAAASAQGIQTAASYRAIFDAANDAIFIHDLQTGAILDVNHKMTEMYGYTIAEARQLDVDALSAGTPPFTQQDALQWLKKTLDGEPQLFEWLAKDKAGRLFWVEVNIKRATIGGAERLLAIVRDITSRKRVEGELRALAGRLVFAKEEENKRLARELHDVFSQKLAVLAWEVAAIHKKRSLSSSALRESLQRFGNEIGRLATDVHQISRDLHPSIVDDLGLIAALRSECAMLSKQHSINAELFAPEAPDSIPADISLSLYRIAQESLWNVAKHAQARRVRLTVAQVEGELLLSVEDDGTGFDLDQVKGKGSLGLVSMEERMRLVNGRFSIQSHPGKGTRVDARVPLPHPEG